MILCKFLTGLGAVAVVGSGSTFDKGGAGRGLFGSDIGLAAVSGDFGDGICRLSLVYEGISIDAAV